MLWHYSDEPENGTELIIVHDYFNHGFDQHEIASYSNGRFSTPKRLDCRWSDYAWKIKKWCYIEDVLKLD